MSTTASNPFFPTARRAAAIALVALVASALVSIPMAQPASAATFTVDTEQEFTDAITAVCDAEPRTIMVTEDLHLAATGVDAERYYTCADSLTIVGVGSEPVAITADVTNGDAMVVDANNSSTTVTIENLSISGFHPTSGRAISSSGNFFMYDSEVHNNQSDQNAGAINVAGNAGVYDSVLTDNVSSGRGGALLIDGNAVLSRSSFSGNEASSQGGAVRVDGDATVNFSVFVDNASEQSGGGLRVGGNGGIFGSTFVDNVAGYGGGLSVYGTNLVQNSTFAGNTADVSGGGMDGQGDTTLDHVTFVGNSAPSGAQLETYLAGSLTTSASVFADSPSAVDNCASVTATSDGYNWSDDASCWDADDTADVSNGTDPGLGPVGENGGFGLTLVPAHDSPLVDAVPGGECNQSRDQRAMIRPVGDGCDIGAVEYAPLPFSDVTSESPFGFEISWLVAKEITEGYDDGTFRPGAGVSRQAMAAFLYRFNGVSGFSAPATPTFTDVPTDHPFYDEIEWLAEEGISEGYGDGTFRPSAGVSRQAMAAFLQRLMDSATYEGPDNATFPDVPTDHQFYDEVEWLAQTGITGGYDDGTFRPGDGVSRRAMAAFLYRLSLIPS